MPNLELELFVALREFRRLHNMTVVDSHELANAHIEVDRLLLLQPEIDDSCERYDAPMRVAHRAFVNSLFNKRRD
jgi:hypothetical protein